MRRAVTVGIVTLLVVVAGAAIGFGAFCFIVQYLAGH